MPVISPKRKAVWQPDAILPSPDSRLRVDAPLLPHSSAHPGASGNFSAAPEATEEWCAHLAKVISEIDDAKEAYTLLNEAVRRHARGKERRRLRDEIWAQRKAILREAKLTAKADRKAAWALRYETPADDPADDPAPTTSP